MTSVGRRLTVTVAALAGATLGVAVMLVSPTPSGPPAAPNRDDPVTTSVGPSSHPTTTIPAVPPTSTLLIWTSGSLPPGLATGVSGLDDVDVVSVVRGGQTGLLSSTDPAGQVVDAVTPGWQIPLDTLAIDPATFVAFLPREAAEAVGSLGPGEGLLTAGSSALRKLGVGATLELTTGSVTVVGVIDDVAGAGSELLVSSDDADRLGVTIERYLLVSHTTARDELQRAAAALLGGRAARFRTPAETTWLRHGDAVEPPLVVKQTYGEFAFRDGSGRNVEVDPAWVARWIVTEDVPILGSVTCHRLAITSLRAAMADLEAASLGYLVDPAAFAGCYSPRRIEAGQPLSHHAWGVAADINVDGNPRGSFSTQDQRLIDTMRRHGWTWGGTWLVPDPAHYEGVPVTTS